MRIAPIVTRLITYIFYVLFFATATLACIAVIFYSSGYRYNFVTRTIQKTGLLVITQMPEGATTLIDGKGAQLKNNRTIPAFGELSYSTILMPGSYDLSITKPEFHSYNQSITIQPEFITKIENVYLLPLQIPTQELGSIKSPYALSNNLLASYSPERNTAITTIDGATTPYPAPTNTQVLDYKWSSNHQYLAYRLQHNNLHDIGIIEPDTQKPPIRLSERFDFVPMPEQYGITDNGHIITVTQGTLYILDNDTNQANIIDTNVRTFTLTDDLAFYLKTDGSIHTFHLNSRKITPLSVPLNTTNQDSIKVSHIRNAYYVLIDKKLFVTDTDTYLKVIDTGVDRIVQATTQSSEVYYIKNSFEINRYSTTNRNTAFVTRTSNSFDEAFELPELPYIIFRSGNHIKVMKNDGTNTVTIFTDPTYSITQLAIDTEYKAIVILTDKQNPTIQKAISLTLPKKPN